MKNFPLGVAAVLLTAGVAFAQTTTTTPGTTPGTPPATMPPSTQTVPPTNTAPMGTTGPMGTVAPGSRAQLSPANNSSTTPPAVTTSQAPSKTAAAPVKGRNSFTMGEARRRIAAGGFAQVTGLHKDRDGIWRGKAMKDGASVDVYCDYQGNVGAS